MKIKEKERISSVFNHTLICDKHIMQDLLHATEGSRKFFQGLLLYIDFCSLANNFIHIQIQKINKIKRGVGCTKSFLTTPWMVGVGNERMQPFVAAKGLLCRNQGVWQVSSNNQQIKSVARLCIMTLWPSRLLFELLRGCQPVHTF